MRKVTAHLFSSVDGVVDSPHLFQFDSFGDEEGQAMTQALSTVDTVILGRRIYDEWSDYWPQHHDDPFSQFINPIPKHVATRTLRGPLTWEHAEVIDGDLFDFVRELKAGDGGDISVNGITVVRELLLAGLLDSLTLTVHPAAAGNGRRLFEGVDSPVRLTLLEGRVTSSGNALLTYALKG